MTTDAFLIMTPYRPRSFWMDARMLFEKDGKRNSDTEWRIYDSDDALPTSLITGIDPSRSLRMTPDVFLIIAPYRPRSFWMDARMLFEKDGKRNSSTEWRIYYADDSLPAFLITKTDSSHSFRMTIDAFLIMTPYRPRSFWMDARMLFEKDGKRNSDTEWRIYYSDDTLPTSLIAETDPSHSFRMTTDAFLIMTPYRPRSFWMDARMLFEKDGKRNSSTEWRIYYADDSLPAFLITKTDSSHSFRMTTDAFLIMTPYRPRSFWTGQECCLRKTGNGTVTQSEESITLMTSCR